MATTLTDKQQRFCEEYLIDLNQTRAYMAAYPSCKKERSAASSASDLLTKPNISARIAELKAKRSQRTEIPADFVLYGLKSVAERCMQQVPVMKWDYENKAMVQETDDEGRGLWEFDSSGANRALELLGKHLGIFEKDNSQKANIITVKVAE